MTAKPRVPPSRATRRRRATLTAMVLLVLSAVVGCGRPTTAAPATTTADGIGLPLTAVTTVPLPGDTSRVDYASIDPAAHRL